MPRNVILIRGDWVFEENSLAVTYAMTPGMLVEPVADGYQPHSVAGGSAAALFVNAQLRDTGSGISGIDDEIAAGNSISVGHAHKGDVINAVTNETLTRGQLVESAGDGTVTLSGGSAGGGAVLGVVYKDSDLSGAVGRVEIIVI